MSKEWYKIKEIILDLEQRGLVTRTFRRLDADRQESIVQAILDVSAEKGPATLNIKEIASRAGVSVGSLYQYFGNRQGLLDFAIELSVSYMVTLFQGIRPYLMDLPLDDAIRAYLAGGIEWGQTEACLVRFFGRAAYQGDPELAERVVRPVAQVMRETVEAILIQAAGRGQISPSVDIFAAARVINALLIVVSDSQLLPYLNTYFQVIDDHMPPERISKAVLGLIIQGIQSSEK
jgi:TetR/AcrR family transcriptional regulator